MLFVAVERRAADPLLDLSLFRKPAFTGVTTVGFALSASIFSMFLYITLFFQETCWATPLQAATISAGHHADPGRLAASGRLTARIMQLLLLRDGLAFVTVGCC